MSTGAALPPAPKPAPKPLPNLGPAPPGYGYPRTIEPSLFERLTAELADVRAQLAATADRARLAEEGLMRALDERDRMTAELAARGGEPAPVPVPPGLALLDAYCDGQPASQARARAWSALVDHLTLDERMGAHVPSTESWRHTVRVRLLAEARR